MEAPLFSLMFSLADGTAFQEKNNNKKQTNKQKTEISYKCLKNFIAVSSIFEEIEEWSHISIVHNLSILEFLSVPPLCWWSGYNSGGFENFASELVTVISVPCNSLMLILDWVKIGIISELLSFDS